MSPGGVTRAPASEDAAGALFALRAPTFAGVTVTLGVGAHVAGGGAVPGPDLLVLILVTVAVWWRVLARGEQSARQLLVGVLAVQLGIHVVLAAAPDPSGHHAHGGGPPGMLLTHTVAALAVAGWLRRGEAAAWRALRRVLPRLLRRIAAPVLAVPGRTRPGHRAPALRRPQSALLIGDPRRGPPAAG